MGYGAYFDYTKNEIKENIMRLIIDIPNSLYANLPKIQNGSIACKRILGCVQNGTPLPKGHGRLIDADDVDNITVVCASNGGFTRIEAPTIIEADGGDME